MAERRKWSMLSSQFCCNGASPLDGYGLLRRSTVFAASLTLFCSSRKDVVDDEIMNTTPVNIEEVADRQAYRHVVREAPRKDQDVFLDWQLC